MTYQILEHVGTISTRIDAEGVTWNKEINLISWNRKKPMIDIREWSQDRSVMRSGIRLNDSEFEGLCNLVAERRGSNATDNNCRTDRAAL